jgi:hypothetical protein
MSEPLKSNTKRDLADIAGDIHALERRSIFDIGKLLIEARDACEHGEWGDWLDREFDWSHDTADNYMAAARLADKFRTVRNLKVPLRTIYELGLDDDIAADLPALIEALVEASKSKPINASRAEEVINLTRLRIEHGDYPEATLVAIGGLGELANTEWEAAATASLKAARPETDEEAKRIVHACRKAHVEALYDSPLPNWLDSKMLDVLEDVTDRKKVLQQLNAATAPLDFDQVWDIACDRDDGGADEPPPRPAPKPPKPEPETQETDPAQAAASAAVRSDIGPLSQAEHERLTRTISDLTNQNNMQKTAISGRDNEIARLESEVKTLRGADLPRLTVNKHLDALIALLRKQSREGQEVAVERLCNALKIDPRKLQLNIENEAA